MDSSEKHTDTIYSVCALVLLCVSLGIGMYFYFSQKDVRENRETMVLPAAQKAESQRDRDITSIPSVNIAAERPMMKIAIPHDVTAVLTDQQGRRTGVLNEKVINEIPLSEFVLDKIAETVGWIIVEEPSQDEYTLDVRGVSDKSIAVYAKNSEGREVLELIDSSQKQKFSIHFDPISADHMIKVD